MTIVAWVFSSLFLSFFAQNSADKVHNDAESVLSDLQHAVEKLQELLDEVMDQAYLEKMNQAQEVVDSLESEIKERKKRDTKMKDLANCEDNIYYLQVRLLRQFSGGCSCFTDLRFFKQIVTVVGLDLQRVSLNAILRHVSP